MSFDPTLFELMNDRYRRTSDVIGGGASTFAYRSLRRGRGNIILRYKRPWEDGNADLRTYEVTVR